MNNPNQMSTGVLEVNRAVINRCPICKEIFCTGEFGPGTAIEVKCKRCKNMFKVGSQ